MWFENFLQKYEIKCISVSMNLERSVWILLDTSHLIFIILITAFSI